MPILNTEKKRRILDPTADDYIPASYGDILGNLALAISPMTSAEKDSAKLATRQLPVAADPNYAIPDFDFKNKLQYSPINKGQAKTAVDNATTSKSDMTLSDLDEENAFSIFDALGTAIANKRVNGSVTLPNAINPQDVKLEKGKREDVKAPAKSKFKVDSGLPEEVELGKQTIGELLTSPKGVMILSDIAIALSQPGSPNARVAESLRESARNEAFEKGDFSVLTPAEQIQVARTKTEAELAELRGRQLETSTELARTGDQRGEVIKENDQQRAVETTQEQSNIAENREQRVLQQQAEFKDYFATQQELHDLEMFKLKAMHDKALLETKTESERETLKADYTKESQDAFLNFSSKIWSQLVEQNKTSLTATGYTVKNIQSMTENYRSQMGAYLISKVASNQIDKLTAQRMMISSNLTALQGLSDGATASYNPETGEYTAIYTDPSDQKEYQATYNHILQLKEIQLINSGN